MEDAIILENVLSVRELVPIFTLFIAIKYNLWTFYVDGLMILMNK